MGSWARGRRHGEGVLEKKGEPGSYTVGTWAQGELQGVVAETQEVDVPIDEQCGGMAPEVFSSLCFKRLRRPETTHSIFDGGAKIREATAEEVDACEAARSRRRAQAVPRSSIYSEVFSALGFKGNTADELDAALDDADLQSRSKFFFALHLFKTTRCCCCLLPNHPPAAFSSKR